MQAVTLIEPKGYVLQRKNTRERILEAGFSVFAERTIDNVNLTDVADAAGVGMATVYRYFNSKPALVLAVATWVWQKAVGLSRLHQYRKRDTAADEMRNYLEVFINMYREHKNLLRFNQYFNIYVKREGFPRETLKPYLDIIHALKADFHRIYVKGEADGTLRTDIPEEEMFSSSLHLMLAAVTRYAIGLVYEGGSDPERELLLLKEMLVRTYVRA